MPVIVAMYLASDHTLVPLLRLLFGNSHHSDVPYKRNDAYNPVLETKNIPRISTEIRGYSEIYPRVKF